MAAPTNISAATAVELGPLPNSITQNVNDSGTTYTVWYKYTVQPTDTVIGIFGFGDLIAYSAELTVFEHDGVTPLLGILGINVPVQIPVGSNAVVYFRIQSLGGNVSPAQLTIGGELAPSVLAPMGSLCVPDDTIGFPLALLSETDGSVLRFVVPFPAGEGGDVLNSGIVAVEDEDATTIALYTPQFVQIGTFGSDSSPLIRAAPDTQFYVGLKGGGGIHAQAKTLSSAGVFGATIGPFGSGGLTGMTPSPDETILYYTGQSSSLNAAIKRWNLTINSALSDLATGNGASYATGELLTLSDGTIVATFFKATASTDCVLKRYDPSGTTLNTYSFGTANNGITSPRLARALDDPNSFWVFLHQGDGFDTFRNIKASTGAELTNLVALSYEDGVSQQTATATPAARFGHSQSCPFFVARIGIAPPTPPFTTTTYPVRRLRQTAHLSDEQLWLFFSKFQLDCQTGVGLSEGQGSDPQVMLSWSDDGGHTWSPERWMSAGKQGEYKRRVIWRQLGRSRDRVWRLVVSDPVAWRLLTAYIDVQKGTS